MTKPTRVAAALGAACALAFLGSAQAQDAPQEDARTQATGEAAPDQAPASRGTADATPDAGSVVDTDPRGVLRFGKLYSFGGGADLQHGFGLDLRYEIYPERDVEAYFGLFTQGQYELGDAWRFVGGVTGGWSFFGLELGVAHRTATELYAGSTGLHIGQNLTFGPVSIGGRLTVPLVDHVPENVASIPLTQGIEGAVTLRLSFGFTVHGERRRHGCHANRRPELRNPHANRHCGH